MKKKNGKLHVSLTNIFKVIVNNRLFNDANNDKSPKVTYQHLHLRMQDVEELLVFSSRRHTCQLNLVRNL